MSFLMHLIIAILCGYCCSVFAKMINSNIIIAWALGLIFNIFAAAGYFIAAVIKSK